MQISSANSRTGQSGGDSDVLDRDGEDGAGVTPRAVTPARAQARRRVVPFDVDERAAQELRAQRLRDSPDMRGALAAIRAASQPWSTVREVLRRGGELQASASTPGERSRTLTPLLAGISMEPRANAVYDVAIDRDSVRVRDEMRRRIGAGNVTSRELVIGSGWHSAVYNAEAAIANPGRDSFTVEESARIGGQFAVAQRPVHLLNSRTRPESRALPHRPGTAGSLNSMGRAPLQPSDVDEAAYGNQWMLGEVIRKNGPLATNILTATSVTQIVSRSDGTIDVSLRYGDTGEDVTTTHDRVVLATGIGDVVTGLEESSFETRRLLRREAEKPIEQRGILLYDDFIRLFGDTRNEFPIQGWKRVAVIGPGDGGRVVVGKLTGHETDNDLSVPNLDFVETVGFYGQKARTKEQFVDRERVRYDGIALEMPRADDPSYYNRVTPYAERATEVAQFTAADGTNRYAVTSTDRDGKTRNEVYDHVVLAPGFVDRTASIVTRDGFYGFREAVETELVYADGRTRNGGDLRTNAREIMGQIERYARTPGTTFSFGNGRANLTVVDFDEKTRSLTYVRRDRFGDLRDTGSVTVEEDSTFLGLSGFRRLVQEDGLLEDVKSALLPPPPADCDLLFTEPIARRFTGTNIYLVGPSANLPITDVEREVVPALDRIGENSAAGFRYVERDQALARQLAARDVERSFRRRTPGKLAAPVVGAARSKRSAGSIGRLSAGATRVQFDATIDTRPLPQGGDWQDMVRLAVATWAGTTPLPRSENQDVTLNIRMVGANEPVRRDPSGRTALIQGRARQFEVTFADGRARRSLATRSALGRLLNDPLLQGAIDGVASTARGSHAAVELRLPVRRGQVDLSRVSAEVVHGVGLA